MTGALAVPGCAAAAAALSMLDAGLYQRLGLPEPAVALRVAVPALRAVAELGGGIALGSLLFAAFVAAPQRGGVLDVGGYLAVRRAGWAAAVAALAAALLAPALAADLTGSPVSQVLGPDWWTVAATLEEPAAWLLSALALAGVAAGGLSALTWRATAPLALLTAIAMVPPAAVGQAAAGADHDWTADAAIAAAVAAGALTGLLASALAHRLRTGAQRPPAARRVAVLVTACWLVLAAATAASGVLLAGPGPHGASPWVVVAAVRSAVLLGCGVLGALLWWRGRVPAATAVLLGGVATVTVLGVALGRWVPPRLLARSDTIGDVLLGYDLPDPVTAPRLLTDWRFNLLFGTLALVMAAAYLLGVRRLARRGDRWAAGRTAAWLGGCAVLLAATSSGIGRFAPGVFSVHMISHMVLNMLVPVLLAMGGPVTLALRALHPAGRGRPPGPREWITALVSAAPARFLSHPLPALTMFVGSFYVLYLTGLFDTALRYHWAHQLMTLHFLLAGYLFFWPLVGLDPAPTRLPHLGRLAVLLASMPFHAFFGITLMSSDTLLGGNFYRTLDLAWVADLLADQKVGGGIAWATGELPMLLVVLTMLSRWARDDAREAARHDRRADADGEADLGAYNAMLSRLAGSART